MVLTKQNFGRFMYTFAVMLSGAFLAEQLAGFDDVRLWTAMAVASLVWVAYYNRILLSRFDYFERREEDEDEELTPPGL